MSFPDDVPTLTDGTVTLRAHRVSDVPGLLEQALDPVSVAWTTVPVPSTTQTAHAFATEVIPAGWHAGTEWAFAVEAEDNGEPRFAGTVSLRSHGERRAEIAFGAHPWARGRGVMLRALNLLLDWGFGDRELQTVLWQAFQGNWASRRVAWRLGFTFDGTVRRWLPQRGELHDAWVGCLLRDDPRRPRTTWLEVPRIVGHGVVLRAHRTEDLPRIHQAGLDDRAGYWLRLPRPYTAETAREYVESRMHSHAAGTALHWAVADALSDELVANISLFDIAAGDDAEIGYWTHPEARGRGVMREACALVIHHALTAEGNGGLGLRRLKIFAAEANTASRHVIEANNFVQVGRLRADTKLGDGTWMDTVAYDLLADEYRDRSRRLS